jgi:spore coat protein CotH
MDRAVDEFHLDNNMQSVSPVSSELSWKLAEIAGIDTVQNFTSQVRRNGSFHGLFTFTEEHDKSWRELYGYEGKGIFYKDSTYPRDMIPTDGTDPDYSVIIAYQEAIEATQSQERREYILDNQNIPNTINLMAFEAIIQNDDWGIARNIDMSHDERTGRYTFLPWDLDGSFYSMRNPISPYNVINTGDSSLSRQRSRYFVTSLYDEPDFRQLYYRRLRTLVDQIYKDDQINGMFDEYFNKISRQEGLLKFLNII